ncbi:MAG: 50S ribosome-binding GTPase [Proteobacteria bacterium]|nr:50S ribosome-binding GTPase [Pseudomonadota bacterium]
MIFGRPGSGKSTFTNALHKTTGLPLHHLDKHFFTKNWIERDTQEFLKIQQSIVDTNSWIIDGNSIKSLEMRYRRADLVLYLNFPRWLCYIRVFKRIFDKSIEIDDRAEDCPEKASWRLLKYMWTFDQRVEKPITYLREKYPNAKFVKISNDWDLSKIELSFVNGDFLNNY